MGVKTRNLIDIRIKTWSLIGMSLRDDLKGKKKKEGNNKERER